MNFYVCGSVVHRHLPSKLLKMMKLVSVFMLVTAMHVSAAGVSQLIHYTGKDVPLSVVFKEVEKQTGLVFFYKEATLENAHTVFIKAEGMPLLAFLDQLLKNQPLKYSIESKTITISRKAPLLSAASLQAAVQNSFNPPPPGVITGRIIDSTGAPLVAATIVLKGTKKGTYTNGSGDFELKDLPADAVLVISYAGFITREIILNNNAGMEPGNKVLLVLKASENKLDELMIIGYGTTTRRLSTGSVSKVSGSEIERQPVSNPILALEGKVPGLFITQNAGYAGANINVNIRGQNSFNSLSTAPLYIIDGVTFGSGPVEQSTGGFSAGIGFSPLNTINPSEIESINVLKDADATAIYGSRGANGVILITTKKGRGGSTRITADFSAGRGKVTNKVKLLNTAQYLSIRKQAFANDGVTPTATNAPDLVTWDQNAYTNFPDLIAGNTSHQANAAFSVSGGDPFTQFVFGGNYRRESTVYNTNTADKGVQFHLNVQHKSHDSRFGMSVSASYNVDNNTIPAYSLSLTNYSLPPNYPLYNPNGSLYFGPGFTSPLAAFNATYNMQSANLITSATFKYTLLPGLDLKASLGYNNIVAEGAQITPAAALNPLNNFSQTSTLNSNTIKTYIAEPQLTYTRKLGRGKLTALAGGSWQETRTIQPYFILGSFSSLQLARSLNALTVLLKSSGFTDYKYASGFGRIAYEWEEKYLVSGNIRRDGSSRFGPSRQFGNFGSVAGAWIFSKESFVQQALPWLSFGKLKASYGTVGNDKILDYAYDPTYNSITAYGATSGLTPSRIANPYVQWEVTKKLDLAIELGFLQDHLLFSADLYRNRSNNLLGTTPLPGQTGFSSYSSNLPATVQNKGLELELTSVNIKNNNLTWTTSVNLTLPQNKLLAFPNLANSSYAGSYVIGQPLNFLRGYHFTGFKDGIAMAQDLNNDNALTTGAAETGKGDYMIIGTSDPKLFGGLSNTITYKGFQLDILFQGIKRKSTRGDFSVASYPGQNYNMPESLLDLPVKYSATAGSAAINAFSYYRSSDASFQDASFIRLKNVSLTYSFPYQLIRRVKMNSLQVYIHAQNLLTFTGYKGVDPETMSINLPPLRMLIAGIKATF